MNSAEATPQSRWTLRTPLRVAHGWWRFLQVCLALTCVGQTHWSALAASPQIVTQPTPWTAVVGGTHTFQVLATGTGPLAYQWLKDGSGLSAETNATLLLSALQTNAAGFYSVVITNSEGAVTSSQARLTVRLASDPVYPTPQAGWSYLYPGTGLASSITAALDGTWNYEPGNWAGDGRGAGNGLVGGLSSSNGVLTIEDGVTTTGGAFNNRRHLFTRNLAQDTAVTNANSLLNDGVTLTFRARLTPASDPWMELTNAPNGHVNNADGKGMFGIRQAGASGMLIGFSLNQAVEDTTAAATYNFGQAGLHMNHLNGNARTNNVDPGEPGTLNLLPLDPAAFHEFWITIADNGTNPGTHRVSIYLDGALTPSVFEVTAGTGSDVPATNYLTMAMSSTSQRGAVDVDFFGYRAGVILPSAFNQPVGITAAPANQFVALGQAAMFNVGVTGTPPYAFQWYRGGAAITGATNDSYALASVVAGDEGALFHVIVGNGLNTVTSTPPAELHILGPPILTAQPQSQTVTNGDAASLAAAASSAASPAWQWRFNGVPVTGATNAVLNFTPATPAHAGDYDVVVSNPSGSVTSIVAALVVVTLDYGDAPNPGYRTLRADDGARHRLVPGVFLGATVDVDVDGQPGAGATGDDLNGTDDEDGVTFPSSWIVGQTMNVTVIASTNGQFNSWVDWNQDGSWNTAGEQVHTNIVLTAGTNIVPLFVPASALAGNGTARFRFNTSGGLASSGPAADGEVEDYVVNVSPRADLAVVHSVSANPVAVNSNLVFSVHLTNAGPSLATGVMLTNVLPVGPDFIGVTTPQGSCFLVGGEVVCDLETMGSGAALTVGITVRPLTSGTVTLLSHVRSAVEDPVPANNSASANVVALIGPSISSQPQSQTITNGSSVTFTVAAGGTAPLTYQWFHAGGALLNKTNATLTLSPSQPSDAGDYFVQVTNQVGAIQSAVATLTVLVPPAIVTQPSSRTNLAGSTASFSLAASGSEPMFYDWRKNGVSRLLDPEEPTLLLPNVQATNAGAYSVVITNAAGAVTSIVVSLTVIEMDFGDAPSAYPTTLASNGARHRIVPGVRLGAANDFEPDALADALALGDDADHTDDEDGVLFATTLRLGQTLSLQVIASTSGVLNAWVDLNRNQSWAQAGEQVFTNRALVAGTNNLSFLVPASATPGVSFARFRFSTASGLTFTGEAANGEVEDYEVNIEAVAEVFILSAVQVDPVAVGSNQVYSILVSNAGPATATGLSLSDALPFGMTFVSATASQGACVHSAGTVACTLGSLNTGVVATVTITGVPGIEGGLLNTIVVGANQFDPNTTNNSSALTAAALVVPSIVTQPVAVSVTIGGTATFSVGANGTALQYQWRLNGTNLPGGTASTFTIANVQPVNEGIYSVRITNGVGAVTSSGAALSILQPVTITTQPQSQTVVAGNSVSFTVAATGTAPFTYQWTFNGSDLMGQTGASLSLTGVQTNQAGSYQVRIGNVLGTVSSASATLNVLVPPFFITQPQGQTNPTATLVTFLTSVGGTAPVRLQWYFNSTNLIAAQTNLTLSITNVQSSNSGAYTLVATNIAGASTSLVATLAVFDMDFGDAPAGYPTTLAQNGARHRIINGIRLGASIDAETNGIPNATATGDDTRTVDDEDGVILPPAGLLAGASTPVSIIASTNGFVEAWIDFNGTGAWADPGEQVLFSRAVVAGTNTVLISVPPSAAAGTRLARFRFCSVGGASFDGYAADGEVEDYQVAILPSIDLRLDMARYQDTVPVTSNVTFTISVTNRGSSTAGLVWVTNALSSAVSFVSYVTSGNGFCDVGGGVVYCLLGDLAPGAGATTDLTLLANATGVYTNWAWAFALAGGTEVNALNNTNLVSTAFIGSPVSYTNGAAITVADATAGAPGKGQPYPSIINVSGVTSAVFKVVATLSGITHDFARDLDVLLVGPRGQKVMLMSDAGGSAVAGVTLTFEDAAVDPLPSSGALASGVFRPSNYGVGADVFPAPAPGAPYAGTLSVFNNTDPNGDWSLYVVDGIVGGVGAIQGGWRLELTTASPIADVAVSAVASGASVALGSNVLYTLTATNRGPAVASQVRLTNALPVGVTFVSVSTTGGSCSNMAGVVVCDLGSMLPGAGVAVSLNVTPGIAGWLTNMVRGSSSLLDLVGTNNVAEVVTLVRSATDVLVAQSAPTNVVLLGQPLVITLNVTNLGPNPATNVRLTDLVPQIAGFVSASASQGACSNVAGVVTCNLGSLAAGARAEVVLTVSPNLVGLMTNQVSVASDEIDSVATNNVSARVFLATLSADLGLSVSSISSGTTQLTLPWTDPVGSGRPVTFDLVVTNRGPNSALNARLAYTVPAGVTFGSASSSFGACELLGGQVRCDMAVIDVGSTALVSIQVIPTVAGLVTNLFSLNADSTDFIPGDNAVAAVLTVLQPPSITTQPQGRTVTNGANVTFTSVAAGSGPLSFQWSRDGVAVPGATGAGLTLNNVSHASRGDYRVRVTNAVGAVTSVVATLVVLVPPTISDVSNQGINEDESTSLLSFVIADEDSGTGGLSVQAFSSNTSLVPAGGLILAGAGGARTLRVVPATNQSGSATITIRVTDASGLFATDTFVLTVAEVNDVPVLGDVANFSMSEDGTNVVVVDISDVETPVAALVLTVASDTPGLISTNGLSFSGQGSQRTLRIVPAANASGAAVLTVRVTDTNGAVASDSFVVTVSPVNDPPQIGAIGGVSVVEDSGAQSVALGGISSGATNENQVLVVTAQASVPGVIQNLGVVYASPGAAGELRFGTIPDVFGSVTVTVTVQDDGASNNVASQSFVVTVLSQNDPPLISGLTNGIVAAEDPGVLSVAFGVADVETPLAALQLSARSSNPGLVADASFQFSGSGGVRSLSFLPATNQHGTAIIELVLADGDGGRVTNRFTVELSPVNDLPTISGIAALSMGENSSSPVIEFAIGDVETAVEALSLSVTSSDSGLFPAGSFTMGGTGTNRTLVLTPAPNRFGTATVTVVLADAEGGTNTVSFGATVIQVIIPPAILVQPVGRTVTNGVPVTFGVTVAGTLPITYQWKLNGSDLPGATNAVLTIASAGATNAGTYRVSAANAAGSILSDAAVLRVLIAPVIESIVRAGQGVEISFPTFANLSYTVEFTDGTEPLVWMPLTTVAGTGAVLTVTDPSSLASRLYRVRVE